MKTCKWLATIPELRLTGQYKIAGQIFALKVQGQGPYWTILGLSFFNFYCQFSIFNVFFICVL